MHSTPLVVTPGEPAGIGAEITLKAWKSGRTGLFFLLDDPNRVAERAKLAGLNIPLKTINCPSETKECFPNALPILPHYFPVECAPGKPSTDNAPSIIKAIDIAVKFIDQGFAYGVVTNPIQKYTLRESGFKYAGHTEYLANLAGGKIMPVMLLISSELRVVPVTIHEPISRIANLLTTDLVVKVCLITAKSLQEDFGIHNPKIWIAGLNPHAGENGTIGLEEKISIAPAIKVLKKHGLNVSGPYPADSMFHKAARDNYDVAICMYHDQALIPLKTLDFWGGVNMTAGLPFVRTSPDHGTALDLAGTGKANPESLINAICLAREISTSRHQFT
mgnify:FL=1